jgi:hypothetical protein
MRRKLQKVSVLATVDQGTGLGCADAGVAFARSLALFLLRASLLLSEASLLRRVNDAEKRRRGK